MSNIHSLVLHVEQLLKRQQLLQQENQALRMQVAEQEEKLSSLQVEQSDSAFTADDEATLQNLIDLIDHNLPTDKPTNKASEAHENE